MVTATKVRLSITKSCPEISNVGIYSAPVFLNAPSITRDQSGRIKIATNDIGPIFYYTLDGSEPTTRSSQYTAPFPADGPVEVRAIAHDPASGRRSPVAGETFGISMKEWTLLGITDEKSTAVLDGDPVTAWRQGDNQPLPVDLVMQGQTEGIVGPDGRLAQARLCTRSLAKDPKAAKGKYFPRSFPAFEPFARHSRSERYFLRGFGSMLSQSMSASPPLKFSRPPITSR